MALNTRIRGEQLLYDDVTIGVTDFKIEVKDGGIDTTQLAGDAVDGTKLADNAVDSEHITAGSVDNAHLAGSITYAKLSLNDGDIPETKLAVAQGNLIVGDASGYGSELDVASAQIVIGDASGYASAVSVTGDVTITNAGVTAIGNTKVTDAMINDDVATGLAGIGLAASSGVLALDLDELTAAVVDVSADSIAIIDATDGSSKKESIADLATAMAGSGITATNGVLSADAVADNIVEADIKLEDESANCNGVTVAFTLASTPIANSVQVFLNGLIQQSGSGKDYTLAGTTVTFVTAPETGDILLIHYTVND